MAADLVYDPTITQNFIHDLESSFWVLFWMILLYVKSSYTPAARSDFVRRHMTPVSISGSGGSGKSNLMSSPIALGNLRTTDNPTLGKLVTDLQSELGERYRNPHVDSEGLKSTQQEVPESIYDTIFSIVDKALRDPDWTESDPPQCQEIELSEEEIFLASSGSKRSRTVAEQGGAFVPEPAAKRS